MQDLQQVVLFLGHCIGAQERLLYQYGNFRIFLFCKAESDLIVLNCDVQMENGVQYWNVENYLKALPTLDIVQAQETGTQSIEPTL